MKLKRAGIITKIVIFAMIVYASVMLINLRAQIDAARVKQVALQQQVADKEASNAELKYEIDNKDDPNVLENAARNNLGYVAKGEKIYN